MRTSRSRRRAGALVAVLAATLLLPFATLARVSSSAPDRHGCHCPVKMACCEAGLCHGDADAAPSGGLSWSACRDEAPQRAAVPAPSTALDSALLPASASGVSENRSTIAFVTPVRADAAGPAPATPPPRPSIASC
jgi:hypothetical protein